MMSGMRPLNELEEEAVLSYAIKPLLMNSRGGAEVEVGEEVDNASLIAAIARFSVGSSASGGRQFATDVDWAVPERL